MNRHEAVLWGAAITDLNHALRLSTTGPSMRPFIQAGDTLIIQPASESILRRGNVVIFGNNGVLVAHRVIKIRQQAAGPLYLIKGDNLTRPDGEFARDRILGKVIFVEGRHWQRNLDHPVEQLISLFCVYCLPRLPWLFPLLGQLRRSVRRLAGRAGAAPTENS